jgi:primary-amine oxidase
MSAFSRYRLLALLLAFMSSGAHAQQQPANPLDGLLVGEHWIVYDVLRDAGKLDSTTKFISVLLREPPKAEVIAWTAGQPFRREAKAVIKQGPKTFEAVVDITGKKLVSWTEAPGVQPAYQFAEDDEAGDLIKNDPAVRDALRKRGFTDLNTIRCGTYPGAYFGRPEQKPGARIYTGMCVDLHGSRGWEGNTIEGLVVILDMNAGKVLKVIDSGGVPSSGTNSRLDEDVLGPSRPALAPTTVLKPLGPGFTLTGGDLSWEDWKLHIRVDPRVGLVVNRVLYKDGELERSVLYEGSLSEIFVPYMDSTTGWYDRAFLDAGEFFAGGIAEPLKPGVDCPEDAAFIGDVVNEVNGFPTVRARTACVFERETGVVAWRHGEEGTEKVRGRSARELVVRWNATLGNYDYLFDWVFSVTGSITIEVGATGQIEARPVKSSSLALDQGGLADRDDRFGRLVAPHVLGVNHDHFFSFRLDLDVDGTRNSVAIDQLKTERLPASHPRRSLWTVDEQIPEREAGAQLDIDMRQPALWRVVNLDHLGPTGYPTSFEIAPDHNAMSLLSPDDWTQKRAGFIAHQLWVTAYSPDERYAAGDYVVLNHGDGGLPAWTKANRPIRNADIVVWYTLGFHHVPRAEDWPVMPTAWHSFELRPFDFFARNPSLDLPPTP